MVPIASAQGPDGYYALSTAQGNPSGGVITGDNLFVSPDTGAYGGRSGYASSGGYSLSGTMHFKFKWRGTDRPCPSVVAKISSYVFVEGQGASASNGLGHNVTRYVKGGVDQGCIVDGTRLYPMDLPNGDTIDIAVSPTASCSDGRITVWVKVSIIPIDVNVAGTLKQGAYSSVLVGQHQVGTLVNPGLDLRTPTWNASAPLMCKSEVFGADTEDNEGQTGKVSHHYTYHEDTDYNGNTFPFYTLKPGLEDVECDVSVWDPVDGNRGGVAPWRAVNAVAPTFNMASLYGTTTVDHAPNADYIHSGDALNHRVGAAFLFFVQTPEPFKSSEGAGTCSVCQTLIFDHVQTINLAAPQINRTSPQGEFLLDTSFPYEFGGDATGTTYSQSDTPENSLFAGTYQYATSFTSHDHFRMFLLYVPPGNDSINVPLKVIPWKWDTYAARSAWTPTANPADDGAAQDYPIDLFQWDHYFSTSSWHTVP